MKSIGCTLICTEAPLPERLCGVSPDPMMNISMENTMHDISLKNAVKFIIIAVLAGLVLGTFRHDAVA
jgi:hypothetical protein